MKGKIFAFFCSLILLAASTKGQTIDGVLYTNFNNYYKWRGGAFDSTLLIPQIAASIGRRPGALRYSTADSSVYSWTGTQWQKVGGSNLNYTNGLTQSGSDVKLGGNLLNGNTNIIFGPSSELWFNSYGSTPYSDFNVRTRMSSGLFQILNGEDTTNFTGFPVFEVEGDEARIRLRASNVVPATTDTNIYKPVGMDANGYLTKLNTWPLPNTDTATVVKAYVTNAETVTITKGQVVYIFGASGDRAAVKLAKNTSDTFSSKTLGIVRADIAAGQAGWVTTQGQVSGINLGAYTAGDILWLDSVPGGFTKTKPVAPLHGVFVGVVERANVGNGLIYVKPQNGQELGELHDTKITSPVNKQVLAYTSATDIWENKTIDSSYFGGNFRNQVIAAQDKAIQWDAADSLFSYNQLKKGTFRTYDFDGLSNISGVPQGSGDCFGITHISSGGTFANLLENNILGISISTGGSATSSPYIAQGYANNTNVGYNVTGANIKSTWMHFRVKTPTLNDGTQRFYTVIGFKNSAAANPAESAYFTYDLDGTQTGSAASANWQCVSALAGNREWTTTSSAVPADTWQTLSIRTTTSSVQFFIDGTLVATHTTRIPVAGRLHIQIFKTNGSTARFLHADYATFNQLNNSDR